LVLALDRKLCGSFVFETPTGDKSALLVAKGRVTKVRTAEPVEPLGGILVGTGALSSAALDAALLSARRQRQRLGEALVQRAVVAPAVLHRGLGEQLARRLAWLGRLPAASIFSYYWHVDFLEDRPACDAEPLALIWRSMRDAIAPHPREEPALSTLGKRPLRLHAQATPERFELAAEERAFVEALRATPESLQVCSSRGAIHEQRARRLVYALMLTRQLQLDSAATPLDSVPPSARATEPPPPKAPDAKSAAPPPAAEVMKRPSPPHVAPSSPPLAPLEQALERAARSTRPPGPPPDTAAATQAFQAARACIGRKQLAEAERHAHEAREADAGNAEYLALHAWVRMQRGALSTPAHATEIMAALDRAVMKARDNVAVRFYRAQALKRLGRDEEAFKDFKFVAKHEPHNIDAVREVRLYLMRLRNKEQSSGLFSKLFLR
jgi:tetratricopeptide (TPR) repeat protein